MEMLLLILAGIFILLLLLTATFLILLVYSGLFTKVDVGAGSPPIGRVFIAYKFARGSYQEVGPLFSEVCKIAPGNKCLGIYYDDPQKVEAKRLRYIVGSVLTEGIHKADEQVAKKFQAEGFQFFLLPQADNVVRTSFPYVTTLSIFIAVQKVYPRMMKYVTEHSLCAHPYLEVYDGKTIHFMAPLSRQGGFYVPEALQDFEGEEPYESFYSDDSNPDTLSLSDFSATIDSDTVTDPSFLESSLLQQGGESVQQEKESLSPVASEHRKVNGSDEESTSSFEELKFDAEAAKNVGVQ